MLSGESMTKNVSIALLAFLFAAAIVVAYVAGVYVHSSAPAPAQVPAPASTARAGSRTGAAPAEASYSLAQVANHASASDCWVVVSGKVYDVTSYAAIHPGGAQAITSLCGTDATAVFSQVPAHQGAGAALSKYYVGALAQ